MTGRLTVAQAREQFAPAGVYLDTASYGLAPRCVLDAVQHALAGWQDGTASWMDWGAATDAARSTFAGLVGVDAARVTVGATVSGMAGLVAASLPAGSNVLIPDVEFASTLFPLLVQADRGVRVRTVAPADLPEAIDATTDLVACSAVQMSTGEVADLDAIAAAAGHHGALTLIDATQGCGWLPLDASRFDAVLAGAYKWLVSPRGTAFMTVSDRLLERTVPHTASWFGGADVHDSYFGTPLRLAADARRLDTSPAWLSWVGTAPALELIAAIGVPAIHEHDVGLAERFRAGIGLPPGDSAIVTAELPGAAERLERAGIAASARGGRLRASFHLSTTQADVDRVLDVLS